MNGRGKKQRDLDAKLVELFGSSPWTPSAKIKEVRPFFTSGNFATYSTHRLHVDETDENRAFKVNKLPMNNAMGRIRERLMRVKCESNTPAVRLVYFALADKSSTEVTWDFTKDTKFIDLAEIPKGNEVDRIEFGSWVHWRQDKNGKTYEYVGTQSQSLKRYFHGRKFQKPRLLGIESTPAAQEVIKRMKTCVTAQKSQPI